MTRDCNTRVKIILPSGSILYYSNEAIIFTASNPSILKRVSHIPHTALPLDSSLAEISSFIYSHFGQRKEKLTSKLSSSIVSPIVYQYGRFNIFRVTYTFGKCMFNENGIINLLRNADYRRLSIRFKTNADI
jgi:hypothetical protein